MVKIGQKIVPHLWYDKEAKEALEFYTSIFPDSKMTDVTTIHGTPSGDSDIVSFELWGSRSRQSVQVLFSKSIRPFLSRFDFDPTREKDAKEKLSEVWTKLSEGGTALMPLDKYPFSEWYGWIQDKYGLTWQLSLTDPDGERRPAIMPSFLFSEPDAAMRKRRSIFICLSLRIPNWDKSPATRKA